MGNHKRLLGAASPGMTVDKARRSSTAADIGGALAVVGFLAIGALAMSANNATAYTPDITDSGISTDIGGTELTFNWTVTDPGDMINAPVTGLDNIALMNLVNDGLPGDEIKLSMARPLGNPDDGSTDPSQGANVLLTEVENLPSWVPGAVTNSVALATNWTMPGASPLTMTPGATKTDGALAA